MVSEGDINEHTVGVSYVILGYFKEYDVALLNEVAQHREGTDHKEDGHHADLEVGLVALYIIINIVTDYPEVLQQRPPSSRGAFGNEFLGELAGTVHRDHLYALSRDGLI